MFRRFRQVNGSSARTLAPVVPAFVEALEGRVLLSASLEAGVLWVWGTPGADVISISRDKTDPAQLSISDNGQVQTFAAADVSRINISTYGGSDRVTADEDVTTPLWVHGGRGADILVGGAGNDTLIGALGADLLVGNEGRDLLRGDAGSDRLIARGGNDRLWGGLGANMLNRWADLPQGSSSNVPDGTTAMFQPYSQFSPAVQNSWIMGITPDQIRKAYEFSDLHNTSNTNLGAGETIVIVGAYDYPTAAADLAVFSQAFDLPAPTPQSFQVLYASGRQPVAAANINGRFADEAALDVQWAHAIAPQAKIVLVEAETALWPDLTKAMEVAGNVAHFSGGGVVSISLGVTVGPTWGSLQALVNRFDDLTKRYSDVSWVAATGDTAAMLSYPAVNPAVLAVGGTFLPLDENGDQMALEQAWSAGGGGPVSAALVPVPGYQIGVLDHSRNVTISATSGRVVPDVAYNADQRTGVAVFSSTFSEYRNGFAGWRAASGTSAGAPQWAGLVALANQTRRQAGKAPLGNKLTPTIYQIARSSDRGFTDVVDGSNGHLAGIRYDEATGWGTPIASELIPLLAQADTSYIDAKIEWNATLTKPIQSRTLPATNTFKGGTGSINGGTNLSMLLSTRLDPDSVNALQPLPLFNTTRFNITFIAVDTLYRRSDNSIGGTGRISYTFLDDGGATTNMANQAIMFEGQISVGSDGQEHISGSFFNVDSEGNPVEQGWAVADNMVRGEFQG